MQESVNMSMTRANAVRPPQVPIRMRRTPVVAVLFCAPFAAILIALLALLHYGGAGQWLPKGTVYHPLSLPPDGNALDEKLLAKGAVYGLYSNRDGHQIAVIRAERIFIDHARMGFFRIGLLPFLAVENVDIEIRDPAEISRKLTLIQSHFARTSPDGSVELRRVRLSFPNENVPRL